MLWNIASAVDAFMFAGEMSESGWYLTIFHGPGIDRLLGGHVPYEDANRTYDTCVYPEDYPAYEALYDLETRREGVLEELTYRLVRDRREDALGAGALRSASGRTSGRSCSA